MHYGHPQRSAIPGESQVHHEDHGSGQGDGARASVCQAADVLYIHRDPRAVVASYYKQRWGYKTTPELFESKTEIELLTEYVKRYEMSFEGRGSLKSFEFHDLAYEHMVDEPDRFFRGVLSRLGLPQEAAFFDRLASWKLDKQANQAWTKQFSKEGIAFLNESLKSYVDFTMDLQRRAMSPVSGDGRSLDPSGL